ncbi:MAG: sulfatase-like hydrolase/transferase [Lachnospiraceae bacterium]|nr:sulfatase-like hydrolase/transferase [Lachnospiraceae bacterium]
MAVDNMEEKKYKKYIIGLIPMAIYFGIFFLTITALELFMRIYISGKITGMNLFFLFFVPAEAMFFTALAGFFKNIGNKITLPILLFVISIYYCVQFVYFRIFGSLFSVSMMGMGGQAVGNFFWAMEEILISSIIFLTLILAPVIASIVVGIIKKIRFAGYPVLMHLFVILLSVALWFAGIQGLKLGGTDKQSAYHVFHSLSVDTDSAAGSLGTLTTFLVECGAYYLGIGNTESSTEELVEIDKSALELIPDEEIVENIPDEESEEEVEEVVEEIVYEPWIDDSFDFEALAENAADANTKNMYLFFAQQEPTYKNEYTGMFEDYNLIYICAEGFWKYACNEKVTPTLYNMSNNGIVLTNYYNSFLNTTTNGEFAFATSLWPDVSRYAMSGTDVGSFPQSASKYMPYGLGDLFSADGTNTYAFHNYYGTYYRRYLSWPNLGYQDTKFSDEMKLSVVWPASDLEMMEQSIDDYIEEDTFHAYYMTFSGHGPYNGSNRMVNRNINEVKELLGDDAANYNAEALNYFACNLELEKAMKYLLERLEEADKLDNTVIVLTGDHYPYYLSAQGRESLVGGEISELEQYHSACIIYNSAIEEPIYNDNYCCNVDIVPTILNLFNLPHDSRLLMGTDVFSNSMHTAMLYNKSFLNDNVEYNSSTKETYWKINTDLYCEEALDAYLNSYMDFNESKYLASINILKYNVYFSLWKDAGLLTDEEIAAENQRAAKVLQTNAEQNAREAEAQRIREEEAAAAAEAEAQQQQEEQQN